MGTLNLRTPPFRSKKLRDDARNYDCVWHPGRPSCTCHLPDYDAGMGQRCHDWQSFHGCMECNYASDHEYRHDYEWRFRGMKWTLERRFESGILVVK